MPKSRHKSCNRGVVADCSESLHHGVPDAIVLISQGVDEWRDACRVSNGAESFRGRTANAWGFVAERIDDDHQQMLASQSKFIRLSSRYWH
jgi:hypothetical protein